MRHNNDYRMLINSKRWREVRDHKLTLNPLCEMCEAEGIVTPARDVHHIIEVESAKSIGEMASLCYNLNNLQSLCRAHHNEIHRRKHSHSAGTVMERTASRFERWKSINEGKDESTDTDT